MWRPRAERTGCESGVPSRTGEIVYRAARSPHGGDRFLHSLCISGEAGRPKRLAVGHGQAAPASAFLLQLEPLVHLVDGTTGEPQVALTPVNRHVDKHVVLVFAQPDEVILAV